MSYQICTRHILEKSGTVAIFRCKESLKVRSMLCIFLGCTYVRVNMHDTLFGIEGVVWFCCRFPCHLMLIQVRTLLDIIN
jgi:hypothetical protein